MRANRIGNYRFFRTLGEGSFAKVKRKKNINKKNSWNSRNRQPKNRRKSPSKIQHKQQRHRRHDKTRNKIQQIFPPPKHNKIIRRNRNKLRNNINHGIRVGRRIIQHDLSGKSKILLTFSRSTNKTRVAFSSKSSSASNTSTHTKSATATSNPRTFSSTRTET